MDPIRRIIDRYKLMVLDGGQATEYEKLGFNLNHHLWSAKLLIENPEAITKVALRYLENGADCVSTATYQASYPGFRRMGLNDLEITGLFRKAVELAYDSREIFLADGNTDNRPGPLVIGSIGSYGACLADGSEYTGDYAVPDEEMISFHLMRIKAMLEPNDKGCIPDLLAFETIPCFNEAVLLGRILRKFPKMNAWISFSISDERHICDGYPLKKAAEYFDDHEQIAAIGVNCTEPDIISRVIEEIKPHTKKPIIIYPNSGESYSAANKTWDSKIAQEYDFRVLAQRWYESGARVIGGCCRTTPSDISKIAAFRSSLS